MTDLILFCMQPTKHKILIIDHETPFIIGYYLTDSPSADQEIPHF
jgi:hypothetical protein